MRRIWWCSATALLLLAALARAGELVPLPLRAAIMVRSVGYERTVTERPGEAVLAVVIGSSGKGAEDGKAMLAVLTKLQDEVRIGHRKVRVVPVTHESAQKTSDELKRLRADIAYFAQGLEGDIQDVSPEPEGTTRIVVCADGGDMEPGCVLGVELADNKPRVVLSMKQANAVGLRFQPEFLRLARILR